MCLLSIATIWCPLDAARRGTARVTPPPDPAAGDRGVRLHAQPSRASSCPLDTGTTGDAVDARRTRCRGCLDVRRSRSAIHAETRPPTSSRGRPSCRGLMGRRLDASSAKRSRLDWRPSARDDALRSRGSSPNGLRSRRRVATRRRASPELSGGPGGAGAGAGGDGESRRGSLEDHALSTSVPNASSGLATEVNPHQARCRHRERTRGGPRRSAGAGLPAAAHRAPSGAPPRGADTEDPTQTIAPEQARRRQRRDSAGRSAPEAAAPVPRPLRVPAPAGPSGRCRLLDSSPKGRPKCRGDLIVGR